MRNGNDGLKPVGLEKPITSIGLFAEHALIAEHKRVALQVRITHLKNQGRTDEDASELFKRTKSLEDYVDGRLKDLVCNHPTAPWFMRITGCSRELMGKLIGFVEQFGKWYPVGDPMIPSYVSREPVEDEEHHFWVWVKGIDRFPTPSKMDKYAGMVPGARREAGKLLDYNDQMRMCLFRLGLFGFMMKQNKYYDEYVRYKAWKLAKLQREGVRVLPTPKGRFCPVCAEEKKVPKTTFYCPECDAKLGKKDEPKGILWEGHLDMMARRWMMKLFLHHWWAVWREAVSLPIREPYPMEYLGHTGIIRPWDMCDLPE